MNKSKKRTKALITLIVVIQVLSCMSPASATFLPWLRYFTRGMGAPGAGAYSAQSHSQPDYSASSSSDEPFIELMLPEDLQNPLEMTSGKPKAFPISVIK